jgi:hypothetical protein
MAQRTIPHREFFRVVLSNNFPPFSLSEIKEEELKRKEDNDHSDVQIQEEVELVKSFKEPLPTRDFP